MPLSLTEEQKSQLTKWVGEGASLAEIQKRLAAQFSISLTYMDARFLLDDLNLVIKDTAKVSLAAADLSKAPPAGMVTPPSASAALPAAGEPMPAGKVRVSVDKVVRPGAVVSGTVTFSDGQNVNWQLDQAGRLALVPKVK